MAGYFRLLGTFQGRLWSAPTVRPTNPIRSDRIFCAPVARGQTRCTRIPLNIWGTRFQESASKGTRTKNAREVRYARALVYGFVACRVCFSAQSGIDQNRTSTFPLQPGVPIQRTLSVGQLHTYTVNMEKEQFVQLVVDQRGIDVGRDRPIQQ